MRQETRKTEKTPKKKSKLLKGVVCVLCVYIVVAFVQLQFEIQEKKLQVDEIMQACEEQRAYNEEIEEILSREDDSEYIERVAREKLGYAYPDERVYIDISGS